MTQVRLRMVTQNPTRLDGLASAKDNARPGGNASITSIVAATCSIALTARTSRSKPYRVRKARGLTNPP
jgi:hypothetical protein